MSLADWILLGLVGLWTVLAVCFLVRAKRRGKFLCCGNCTNCKGCAKKSNQSQQTDKENPSKP